MKIGKGEKPESNLYDRKNYANKKFKTSIKLQLVLQKVHRVIRFKQKAKLKPYINMDTELRKKNSFSVNYGKCTVMKILSLHQTKQKGPIWCQNQTIIQPFLFSKFISNRNEKKNTNIHA